MNSFFNGFKSPNLYLWLSAATMGVNFGAFYSYNQRIHNLAAMVHPLVEQSNQVRKHAERVANELSYGLPDSAYVEASENAIKQLMQEESAHLFGSVRANNHSFAPDASKVFTANFSELVITHKNNSLMLESEEKPWAERSTWSFMAK